MAGLPASGTCERARGYAKTRTAPRTRLTKIHYHRHTDVCRSPHYSRSLLVNRMT
jgi:hypothetical protein